MLAKWEVDASHGLYMKNLITDFAITCESKFGIGLIGSMYFLGEAIGSMLYVAFSKRLGETRIKHILVKNALLVLILGTLVLCFRSLMLLYVSMFCVGLCQSIAIIQGYAYNMEMMPIERRNLISICTGMLDKVLLTITTLILKYYGSNWIQIMIPGLMCSLLASGLSFIALDSPQLYHDKGNFEKSKAIFQSICRWNGVEELPSNFVFENEPIKKSKRHISYLSVVSTTDDNFEEKSTD